MMPKIETKTQYKLAIQERDQLTKNIEQRGRKVGGMMRIGVLNDAIAEYEENQKQLPDLSFITELKSTDVSDLLSNAKGFLPDEKYIYLTAIQYTPKTIAYLIKASESDPEAAQLLKDIANVNK